MSSKTLLQPLKLAGDIQLKNRIALAPLTRARADADHTPNSQQVKYYQQRAGAGLLITEATIVTERGIGWSNAPGIWTKEMCDAWNDVVTAVHKKNTPIFMQLWHCGRASHSSFQPENMRPMAPSAIKVERTEYIHTPIGKQAFEVPREMTEREIWETVIDFKYAASLAKESGFDGVELHAANGYMIDSFLQSNSNQRTDRYGGSIEKRFTFLREVIEAVLEYFPEGLAVRLSPNGIAYDTGSPDNHEAFTYYVQQLNEYPLSYLHMVDGLALGFHGHGEPFTLADTRKHYQGTIIGNCGYDFESAEKAVASGDADVIAFGRDFISTPDLVYRYEHDLPLNDPAPVETYYSTHMGAQGYTDFPAWDKSPKNPKRK